MCVSRILRKRVEEELDENCIVQPGRDIPKGQYVRRRAYTKKHKSAWEEAIEKYKYVKCIFQNCHFLGLSVEDMISHFGYCNGDGSFAKFICPYCEGRVTSEKILGIHIKRSHELEHYGIINNHFLDIGDASLQCEDKQFATAENEYETFGDNFVVDVKVEEMGCNYDEGMVSQGLFISESEVPQTEKNDEYTVVDTYDNEFNCGEEMEVEEIIPPNEQNTEVTKPTQGKGYRGDHIYFKKMEKSKEDESDSLSVMKNTNLKHYSGPRNITDKTNYKLKEWLTEDVKESEEDSSANETQSDAENDKSGKFVRKMFKVSFPSAQNTRRKVHKSYTNSWNQSIKANGFARCLVATCNFISLDIFHIQNHFKTCNGVPANGPNLCTICNSWLPSAVELSIHSESCKTFRSLTDPSKVPQRVTDGVNDVTDVNSDVESPSEQKNSLDSKEPTHKVSTVSESDSFQLGQDKRNKEGTEALSKKDKSPTLRISDILKLKDNGNMDINRIIQPGPVLPKGQYLRRRAYTKQHKAVWEAALEKHKYVKCIFQNCHFVAMSLEDMIYHFGYCIGDGSFARFECPHCGGRLTTKMVLDIHVKMSHPEMVADEYETDAEETHGECESNADDVLPSVEELKKLVNSREIKTYGRQSKICREKTSEITLKCESYGFSGSNEEAGSCVAVVLGENPSSGDGSSITVTQNSIGDISNVDDGHTSSYTINEQAEACSGKETISVSELQPHATDLDSEYDKSSEKIRKSESLLVDHEAVAVTENVICIQLKNCENSREEVEDPGAHGTETDQEKSVKEGGKNSERNGQSNGESSRSQSRNTDKPESRENNSSTGERSNRGRGRWRKSPDPPRRGESEPKFHQKATKRKAEEKENEEEENLESDPKMLKTESVEDEGGTRTPRRRGRPPKKSSSTQEKPVTVEEPVTEPVSGGAAKKGKRGRKRKNEEETDEVAEVVDSSEVKCAKCDFKEKRHKFSDHNFRKHIGLSWIEGETPIDPGDQETISYNIKQAFKVIKSATCEICNSVKKSALGFISHIQNCGKSEEEKEALKVTCPHCPSRVLRYSLPMHLKLSHSDSPPDGSKTEEETEVLSKRKSAIRAANKVQEALQHVEDDEDSKIKGLYALNDKGMTKPPAVPRFIRESWRKLGKHGKPLPCRWKSCKVESANLEDAKLHHYACPELPEKSFVCLQCDFFCSEEDDVKIHVKLHSKKDGDFTVAPDEERVEEETEQNDVEDAVDFVRNRSRIPENPLDALEAGYKLKFFVRENLLNGRQTRFCRQSLRMTLKSELEAVKDPGLPLSQLRTNANDWTGVSLNVAHKHLPIVEESMPFFVVRDQKPHGKTWKKLGRFEGEIVEDSPVIFTGGSVLSMSWCKNSIARSFNDSPRQYLSVSSSKDMRKFQNIHEVPENFYGFIQIWDCGELKSTREIPKMVIGIIHDSGQVWDVSWFPMDTYEEGDGVNYSTRIGILGAACQDGTVRIWSICDPQKLKNKFRLPLYTTDPKVVLELEGGERIGCLRLAIGKTGTVVGGYANGMIAVWNLKSISSPFCKMTGKSLTLKPHLSFQAHRTSITALSICPNNDRYIATSGLDRCLKLWDLECVINPIESTLKEVCLDNTWSIHWPLTISTFEDVIPSTGKGMVKPIRDAYCDKHRTPLTIDNTCWSVSMNDWMNAIAGSSSKGDVKIRYMRNMFTADEKFRLRTGHLFSSTEIKFVGNVESDSEEEKSKNAGRIPRNYEESHWWFALIFHDYAINDSKSSEPKTKKKVIQSMEEYPITSVNKICWNANYGCFKFLAMGHQSGFVRIRELEDVKCDEEVVRFYREAKNIINKE